MSLHEIESQQKILIKFDHLAEKNACYLVSQHRSFFYSSYTYKHA